MIEILCIKNQQGAFIPMNDDEHEKTKRIKAGAVTEVRIVQKRNPKFFRKFFVLRDFLFDIWEEGRPEVRHKGVVIRGNKERFRKDLLIMAGYYDVVVNVLGETRLEAQSMAWDSMDEDVFEKLFSACIDVGLAKIVDRPDLTAEAVRNHCETLINFSR